ncbi:hypothetical protein [Spirosoma flavum]|uniref:Uncharacterized protein n=1 Tax=Spirosoma flavum TaxID=2048557 RepID=A0ABW6AUZ2_9BACT
MQKKFIIFFARSSLFCIFNKLKQIKKMSKKGGSTNNSGQTTSKVATIASKVLQNPNASKVSKTLAGSVLSQAPNKKK